MTASSFKQTLRYISHFGLGPGLQAARVHGHAGNVVAIQLPQLAHPVRVRAGTSDAATFAEVFVTRQYDVALDDFAPVHILDLGANVGFASICFASRWPRAHILAVEPASHNLELLRQNTAPWPGITCIQAAVWSRPGKVRIMNPKADANAFRTAETEEAGSAEDITAYTVAQLMDLQGCGHLDLVKMDVEGAEAEIFRGNLEWLEHVSVLMIELHDRIVPGCAESFYAALRGRHFAQEVVGSNLIIDLRQNRPVFAAAS